jgi:hypothetical protein
MIIDLQPQALRIPQVQKSTQQGSSYSLLRAVLWLIAAIELAYFTGSHWFFHRAFFNALGITGPDLESPFVISQLQLIGVLVMGYALMNVIIARDPERYRPFMAVILAVGIGCVIVFVGSVWAGTLPALFLINALLLSVQVVLVACLFPWKACHS